MEQLLAKQPIFNEDLVVIAYELLYRGTQEYTSEDGDEMTSQVISQSFLGKDISKIVANKKVFINFPEQMILDEVALILDKDRLVVEVLESVPTTSVIIEALKKIKIMGYTIALDDITADLPDDTLLELADIAKIDFMGTTHTERIHIINYLKKFDNLKLLAEKVETPREFREACSLSFDYFQGYFFARPDVLKFVDPKPLKINQIRLLSELFSPNPSYEQMAQIVESDVSLTYKLLKIINSVAYYRQNKITSINQALVMLGFKELRKWITYIIMRDQSEDKPNELFKIALTRGKMVEMLCTEIDDCNANHQGFLVGLLSLIDVMTDRAMDQILGELPLDPMIKDAILDRGTTYGKLLAIIEYYENSDWDRFETLCKEMDINMHKLPHIFLAALEWAEALEIYEQ